MDAASFACLVRSHRVALGLTQEELAERARLSAREISDLERGLKPAPRASTVRLLAEGLRLSADEAGALLALGHSGIREVARAANESRPRHNLPRQLTSFVGRTQELVEVQSLVERTPLLTLVGPGGVGKTRLALEVAAGCVRHASDGAWLVELASLTDPNLVPQRVAATLSISERGRGSLLARLLDCLQARRLLLVLDNCEHLLDSCAEFALALLTRCPGVQILATSREALSVSGEIAWPVPPLPVPKDLDPGKVVDAESGDAVQLFVERARAANPYFTLTEHNAPAVIEACRRLDGIPLAVELAAAQMRSFGPEQLPVLLADRFRLLAGTNRGAPPRQRALRATIDWSYDLLPRDQQALLNRLAVFSGGWTLVAAQTVCATTSKSQNVPLLLSRLVSASLVVAERAAEGAVRFRLFETIRDYAAERLALTGDLGPMREQHARYFLNLSHELGTEERLRGREAQVALERLGCELDNVRAAFRWALEADSHAIAISLAEAMSQFWDVRGYYTEGRRWFDAVLNLPEARARTRTRAALLYGLARCVHRQGDFALGGVLQEEGLAIGREIDDPLSLGNALYGLGFNASMRGQYQLAVARYFEALSLYRRAGNTLRECATLINLAITECRYEDFALARAHAHAAEALAEELGSQYLRGLALRALAQAAHGHGEHVFAERSFREAIALERRMGVQWMLGNTLEDLGWLLAGNGRVHEAWSLFAEGLQVHERTGERLGVVRCLEGLAGLVAPHAPELALLAAGAASQTRVRLGTPALPREQTRLQSWQGAARRLVGPSTAEHAIAQGQRVWLDDAVARMLQAGPHAGSTTLTQSGGLTKRECEVLKLLATGSANSEIANSLVLSIRTVERHIANIYSKVGARGRADATAYAFRNGIA